MKQILVLFLCVACILLFITGCTININLDNPAYDTTNDTENDYSSENISGYQSRATIYMSNKNSVELPAISSSDLIVSGSLADTYAAILQSDVVQDEIRKEICKKHPDANIEYTLTLEPLEETEIYAIIAISENAEHLEEICNTAVSVFCEKLTETLPDISCKIIDYAKSAQCIVTN